VVSLWRVCEALPPRVVSDEPARIGMMLGGVVGAGIGVGAGGSGDGGGGLPGVGAGPGFVGPGVGGGRPSGDVGVGATGVVVAPGVVVVVPGVVVVVDGAGCAGAAGAVAPGDSGIAFSIGGGVVSAASAGGALGFAGNAAVD
jgi:hypothetical protein